MESIETLQRLHCPVISSYLFATPRAIKDTPSNYCRNSFVIPMGIDGIEPDPRWPRAVHGIKLGTRIGGEGLVTCLILLFHESNIAPSLTLITSDVLYALLD